MTVWNKANGLKALGAATLLSFSGAAHADDQDASSVSEQIVSINNGSLTQEFTGTPVSLKYGRGINPLTVKAASLIIKQHGCEVTVVDGGAPRRVSVSTNGNSYRSKDPIDAAGWARDHCQEDG